jgi:2-methylcitrate dehydratase
MNEIKVSDGRKIGGVLDTVQETLATYAVNLRYDDLDKDDVHETKVRFMDSLGGLAAGFEAEPCVITRKVAFQTKDAKGATIYGTSRKAPPDMAAFANATGVRYAEMNDVCQWAKTTFGHPSDVTMGVLAVAEKVGASGREFMTALVLAYEVYMAVAETLIFQGANTGSKVGEGFDHTNLTTLGTAIACGKLLGLDLEQMRNCISMAVVPNNAISQTRRGNLTMWKATASGQAARNGVFAAQLAKAGMEGPSQPFEGGAGWFKLITRKPVSLVKLGGQGNHYRIRDTLIKPRAACAGTISSILAAEHAFKAFGKHQFSEIDSILVEAYSHAAVAKTTPEHRNPVNRETADHSIPYVVAVAMMDGEVGPRQFDDDRLWHPELRALIPRIEVVPDAEMTAAYERWPVEHRTRVTVRLKNGEKVVGESGGDKGDLSNPRSDQEIEAKFHMLSDEKLGKKRVNKIIGRLWKLEKMRDVAQLAPDFVID